MRNIPMLKGSLLSISVILLLYAGRASGQEAVTITVEADQPLHEIQPTMWGLFFEDINFAADGGLYAELVKNRSFEFPDPLEGWTVEGAGFFNQPVQFVNRAEKNSANPRFARVSAADSVCMVNSGFRGMGIRAGEEYLFSMMASTVGENISIQVHLLSEDGREIGKAEIQAKGIEWRTFECTIRAAETDTRASLKLCIGGEGLLDFDMVSLFPVNTWKQRPRGLRADLVQLLHDLEPGFLRFPGGCIVEGRDLEKRYQWKNTVGKIEDRGILINRWNDENTRATPDYYQSFGLGFFEYFLLAEDLGAEAVPILNCGMACQFNTGEVVAMDQMEPYVQDALDLIEFANGPADTRWGRVRAEMGHPDPFRMKYLGIGNEQWGPQYFERYALFEETLSRLHPEIMLISTTGPMPGGPLFEQGREALKEFGPALVDEHYYNSPQWFFSSATRYDDYDRNTYKVFAGEYAAHNVRMASPENTNTWETALAEAAFMTGLERNADVVHMASYAPLLAHSDAWQWTPDLIWFDNLASYGTPSYHVQKMFSTNRGTEVLKIHSQGEALTGKMDLYASAVVDSGSGELILKIVSNNELPRPVELKIESSKKLAGTAELIVLQSKELSVMNSHREPLHISPMAKEIRVPQSTFTLMLDPYSLTIIKLKHN